MLRTMSIAACVLVTLQGCANLAKPSVQSALIEAGVRPSVAACMADRMTDRLSVSQLQKLRRVKGPPGEKASDLSAMELLQRVNRIGDPEVVSVTVSAGAACALIG